jgi:4-diphosphocytidyl-2-C-methyl-D-erythritol kinase
MSGRTRISAHAKINLSLRVLGKRPDGFHEIESLMAPVDLADEIEIASGGSGIRLRCSDPSLPAGEENLVVKAALAFCRRTGTPPDFEIALEKRIPHGAGLGGGSSDAAATLKALNDLAGGVCPPDDLIELAATLGSDAPFFLAGGAAKVTGRGERIEPVPFPHRFGVLLVKPPFGVPTPWAYGAWKDSREIPGVRYAPQPMAWGDLINDLERPVFEKYLLLADLKGWLSGRDEVAGALMTGSGSAMIAVLRDGCDPDGLEAEARSEFGSDLWTCHSRVG